MTHDRGAFLAFNAAIEKARIAYVADMAVENDLCAVCQVNRRDVASTSSRRCLKCRPVSRTESAR